jgi:hypothetical protein
VEERSVVSWKIGELELGGKADVSIDREPALTITIDWHPSAEAYAKAEHIKDDWLRSDSYEFSTPAGDSWAVTPSEWVEMPNDEGPPTVRIKLLGAVPEGHGPNGTPLELMMDVEARPEERQAVADALREFQCEAGNIGGLHRRSIGDLPWTVYLETSLRLFFEGFATTFGAGAALALMSLVKKIFKARGKSGREGSVTLIDNDTYIHVVINQELPEEAYQRLLDLDFTDIDGECGQLHYDPETGEWKMPW